MLKPKHPKLHVAHPVVHLFGNTRSNRVDGLNRYIILTRDNRTDPHPLDIPAHSLKVETRVRTPLGLLVVVGGQGCNGGIGPIMI